MRKRGRGKSSERARDGTARLRTTKHTLAWLFSCKNSTKRKEKHTENKVTLHPRTKREQKKKRKKKEKKKRKKKKKERQQKKGKIERKKKKKKKKKEEEEEEKDRRKERKEKRRGAAFASKYLELFSYVLT